MAKKKTLKKHGLCLDEIEGVSFNEEKAEEFTEYCPEKFFKNYTKVAKALLQCLLEGDAEAYKEILDSFLRVNRSRVANNAKMSRTTVQNALSSKGNPTIRTVAKIVHHQALDTDLLKDTKR
jgi:DNA-binding phage protein